MANWHVWFLAGIVMTSRVECSFYCQLAFVVFGRNFSYSRVDAFDTRANHDGVNNFHVS